MNWKGIATGKRLRYPMKFVPYLQLLKYIIMGIIEVKFKRWTCRIVEYGYNNGRIALELEDIKTGETVLCATVNIPEVEIPEKHVIIKNYSENEGIEEILIAAGVIDAKPEMYVESIQGGSNVEFPVYKLIA